MKRVYTCFCTDVIHEGHMNILREARKYGDVTVGVLSDAAMIRFNRFPTISFEERVQLVRDIPEVSNVVVQDDVFYDKIIHELKPDYVIHGDNFPAPPRPFVTMWRAFWPNTAARSWMCPTPTTKA